MSPDEPGTDDEPGVAPEPKPTEYLLAGDGLFAWQYLQSPSQNHFARVDQDGNLLVCAGSFSQDAQVIYSTGLDPRPSYKTTEQHGTPPQTVDVVVPYDYMARMQPDGNFCIYDYDLMKTHDGYTTEDLISQGGPAQGDLRWQSQTSGKPCYLIMQDDGNLCIYQGASPSEQGAIVWGSLQH